LYFVLIVIAQQDASHFPKEMKNDEEMNDGQKAEMEGRKKDMRKVLGYLFACD
jgi:hypothetical protein